MYQVIFAAATLYVTTPIGRYLYLPTPQKKLMLEKVIRYAGETYNKVKFCYLNADITYKLHKLPREDEVNSVFPWFRPASGCRLPAGNVEF